MSPIVLVAVLVPAIVPDTARVITPLHLMPKTHLKAPDDVNVGKEGNLTGVAPGDGESSSSSEDNGLSTSSPSPSPSSSPSPEVLTVTV